MTSQSDPPIFKVDEKAVLRGGEVAGQYLDEIGISDLCKLNKAQWTLFCTKLVGGALLASIGDLYGSSPPF